MKVIYACIFVLGLCACKEAETAEHSANVNKDLKEQLFVFSEAGDSESCGMSSGDSILFGGLLLTEKGNIIVNFQTTHDDSTRCYWGSYEYADKNITYTLSSCYSFKGTWAPDVNRLASGSELHITPITDTLYATHCANEMGYYRPFSKFENTLYGIKGAHKTPQALYYMPYKETANMKFFTWFFRQIPQLENL